MPLALYLPPEIPALVQPAAHVSGVPGPALTIPLRPNLGVRGQLGGSSRTITPAPNAADATKHPLKPQNTCQGPADAPEGDCGFHGGGLS
jgi:hypothetical protein